MKYFRHVTQTAKTAFLQRQCRFGRKKWSSRFARLSALALAILLTISLFPLSRPEKAQAAGSVQEMANLVIFVKDSKDSADVFNAGSNWSKIKGMYDTDNNSFSNYISTITEGKVHVTNYFPQESVGGTQVQTLALSGINLSDTYKYGDTAVVEAVLDALGTSIPFNTSVGKKYDNRESGVLDNLTIVIQSTSSGVDTVDGQASSYKNNYGGSKTAGGLKIRTYNVLYSNYLVSNDGSLKVSAQQGVIAHEFLHTLGLPDLYRLNSPGEPVGFWDIMAKATCFPQYPLSYLRAQQGWISMGEITQSGTYTLTAVSASGGNKVFALKTPLSDTELICIEYRMKNDDIAAFEYIIPSSGLLMYRVNNNVQHQFNSNGENYIYVYRPGVTDPEAATDVDSKGYNLSWNAALKPSRLNEAVGEGSYGSTDLSADFTQDTLYYSDGRNSGIRISDVRFSGNTATFTVTFADYSKLALWEKVGESVGTNVSSEPVLYSDPVSGALYLAYEENNALFVKKWNGNSWQPLGSSIPGAASPALIVCDGVLYLSVANSNRAVYYQLSGNSWTQLSSYDASYPQYMQFIADGNELYGAYVANSRLTIRNIKTGALVTDSLSGADFANPSLIKLGDCFYMVCAELHGLGSGSKGGHIKMYNMSDKSWSTVYTLSDSFTNDHHILKQGQKIYAYAGYQAISDNPGTAVFAEFDGNSWSKTTIPAMLSAYSVSMNALDGEIYLSYQDNADNKKAKVLKREGSSFSLYNDTLGTKLKNIQTCSGGGTLYAITQNENSSYLNIWKKTVSSGLPSVPTTPGSSTESTPRKIVLTPPAGYQDNHIYIDGIEYTAQKTGSGYSLELPDTTGKTAVMYCYNEKNVPVGMYVWMLSWQGQFCQATPLPGLQDLLSYHGFSIRIKAPAGIRFKSGIDASVKRQLLSGGIDGYHLKEYGTLFITGNSLKKYPLIKGGTAVNSGRAYYHKSDGTVYDKVFETVAGRNRFTSVLINVPASAYAADLVFRSYVVLDCEGQELVVYGPPMRRNIYTVAKQMKNAGEFKPGTDGYNYIQSIIDSVEKK